MYRGEKSMKQYLSKEQMWHLIEMGINVQNALLCWTSEFNSIYIEDFDRVMVNVNIEDCHKMPTLTIGELIDRLPIIFDPSEERFHSAPHERVIAQNAVMYMCPNNSYGYSTIYKFADCDELIDNLYDCYVQLIKDGVIKL